jgi:CHAT domain-containing protein
MTDLYEATFDWRKGNLDPAVHMAQQAHTIFQNNGFQSLAVQCTIILGEIALVRGNYEQASTFFSQGMAYLQQADLPAISFACRYGLARTHQHQNQFPEALTHYRQAMADIERLQASIGAEDYKIAFLSDKLQVYQALVLLCLDLKTAVSEQEAFETVERAKSRTLLDNLAREKSGKSFSEAEAGLIADINRLKQELNWYYNRLNHPQIDPDSPETLAELTSAVSRRERALSQRLKKWRSPDLETVPRNPIWTITLKKIQAILPHNTLLLEFYTANNEVVVFGITTTEIWSHRYKTPVEQISEFLSEFRFQINKFSYGTNYRQRHEMILKRSIDDSLHKLHQALIAPIENHLTADTILIVPHGLLHYIPFHATYDGRNYLIERQTVSYAPSATVLYHTLTAKKQQQTCAPIILGLADETIPFAEEEAQAISDLFPKADVRLHEQATLHPEQLWAEIPAFVHLSTHATFRADNPLFSAVKLSDRWLSVNDIYGMDAPVPLITLSACETGQNQVLVGDELVGLCRGFFAAGVHSMVVSLWMVDDHATTQLMTKFYQGLQAGLAVNKALRDAQLAMKAMSATDSFLAHPYYWASFILTGNMQTRLHPPGGSAQLGQPPGG